MYLTKYYRRWMATSYDRSKDRPLTVYIEGRSFEEVRTKIINTEIEQYPMSVVEFVHIEQIEGVLWK